MTRSAMRLGELFEGLDAETAETIISGMTADSRQVAEGDLFAALEGVAADGRQFIPQAVINGAAAVLASGYDADIAVPLVTSREPRRALALAAATFYGAQPNTMIAITGTNGKSSTVDFLRQLWSLAGIAAASMGTLGAVGPEGAINLGHTTPDPVTIHQALKALKAQGVTHAAMEASSHGLAQYRLDGVKLSAGAFTNFTQDHLDYHADMDEYREAKLRLFRELLPRGAPVIINADDPNKAAFEDAARIAGLEIVSVGWRGADLKIKELMPRATGQKLFLDWRGEAKEINLPLIGEFQALNALTAASIALATGSDFGVVASGLEALKPVIGRLEFVGETQSGAGVFVDFAHTPDGLDTLLRAARPHTAGKLVLVFGCGGDRDPFKRPLMGEVAARHADKVIVTDDNPRSEVPADIRTAIMAACDGADEIGDRGEAIRAGIAMLEKGDTLLIAGKGHETGQIVGNEVIPFSDQETVLDVLSGVDA